MLPLFRLLLFTVTLLASVTSPSRAQAPSPEQQTVERFLQAYNRHDVDAMLALAHPDVQWLSVDGAGVSTETTGLDALKRAMTRYFASLPSSRSTAEGIMTAGRFVSVWERAHWQSKSGGPRTQGSLAVYEVEQGKIRRVWYYPPQP